MILQVLFAVFFGIGLGIVTGLIPGIHVNLISAMLITSNAYLLGFADPLTLACFILSLAVTHSFLDTIPSIYLGVPENENSLAVLPGQKMLLQGDGHLAVTITVLGTFLGLILALLLSPLFIISATSIFNVLKPYLVYLLLAIIIYMLLKDNEPFMAVLLFSLSGVFGVLVFSLPSVHEPLFPMLSGIFGLSGIAISFIENATIPPQKIRNTISLRVKDLIRALAGSSVAVFLIQFFPGMGPTQGAALSGQLIKEVKDKAYMALIGAMGTMSVVFSLATFYALGKAKDGSIVAIQTIMDISKIELMILLCVFLIAGCIATILTLVCSKIFAKIISRIHYKSLIIAIMCFIILMVLLISGWLGLLILFTGTAIGLIAPLSGTNRSHAMGCLILPVILYYIL